MATKVLEDSVVKIGKNVIHETGLKDMLNFFYPVGTIYETTSSNLNTPAKMNAHFGGTWESYGDGMVTVGIKNNDSDFNVIGKVGGAKTHTLTVDQIPSHAHSIEVSSTAWGNNAAQNKIRFNNDQTSFNGSIWSNYTGGGQAHNNLQPYVVVYRYRRIA